MLTYDITSHLNIFGKHLYACLLTTYDITTHLNALLAALAGLVLRPRRVVVVVGVVVVGVAK